MRRDGESGELRRTGDGTVDPSSDSGRSNWRYCSGTPPILAERAAAGVLRGRAVDQGAERIVCCLRWNGHKKQTHCGIGVENALVVGDGDAAGVVGVDVDADVGIAVADYCGLRPSQVGMVETVGTWFWRGVDRARLTEVPHWTDFPFHLPLHPLLG